jgi:hypothetical protein
VSGIALGWNIVSPTSQVLSRRSAVKFGIFCTTT